MKNKTIRRKMSWIAGILLLLFVSACGPGKQKLTLAEACETEMAKNFESQINTNPQVAVTLSPKGEDTLVITVQVKSARKDQIALAYFQTQMSDIADKYGETGVYVAECLNEEYGTKITTVSILFTDSVGERIYSVASKVE